MFLSFVDKKHDAALVERQGERAGTGGGQWDERHPARQWPHASSAYCLPVFTGSFFSDQSTIEPSYRRASYPR